MGFIENAADAAVGLSLDRVRQNLDASSFDPRPDIDLKQAADLKEMQADGRTDEPYRQVLEHFRFRWWPLQALRGALPSANLKAGKTEGEWRNAKLKLAFTPSDLTGGFPGTPSMSGPEQLDRHLRELLLEKKVARGLVPKEVLREARRRK